MILYGHKVKYYGSITDKEFRKFQRISEAYIKEHGYPGIRFFLGSNKDGHDYAIWGIILTSNHFSYPVEVENIRFTPTNIEIRAMAHFYNKLTDSCKSRLNKIPKAFICTPTRIDK
jgi:hypothetical protein